MDIKEFQEKLKDIVELAHLNKNMLTKEMTERFFEGDLSEDQMANVYDYLQTQKIRIVSEKDFEEGGNIEPDDEDLADLIAGIEAIRSNVRSRATAPMSAEEEAFIKKYAQDMLTAKQLPQREVEEIFKMLWNGDETAKEKLIEQYLPKVVEIVREIHQADYFAGDLIQEGSLALVAALSEMEQTEEPDKKLCEAIKEGIYVSMEENERSKWEDDLLINRVEKLESAVRELSETGEKYSVEELSAFLDMSVEEIRDILRLTGDDK